MGNGEQETENERRSEEKMGKKGRRGVKEMEAKTNAGIRRGEGGLENCMCRVFSSSGAEKALRSAEFAYPVHDAWEKPKHINLFVRLKNLQGVRSDSH